MPQPPRRPIVELLEISLPTIAQMASYTVMQFIDRWMLSRLGDGPPTAAMNGGMVAFTPICLGMGILVLVNTLVSQSFGRKDFAECGRFLWQGIWLGILLGVCSMALVPLVGPLFSVMHHPADIAAMEAAYCRILLLGAVIKLIDVAVGQFLLGVNRPRAVFVAALLGVSFNALAAWCIVLGHLGFHSHGVVGAAWAQNLGIFCELATLCVFVLRPAIRKTYNALDAKLRPRQLTTLVRVGFPSGMQWLSDVLAWAVFLNVVLGVLGPVAMAGNAFMFQYMVVTFMPVYGIGTAVTALVGRYIGRGEARAAAQYTHLAFGIATAYIVFCGIIFIVARRPLIELFTHDPAVIHVGSAYMIYCAVYELFDAMYIIYGGALRGAGDTLVPAVVMACLCWTISVTGGYVVARWVPALSFHGPWMMGVLYGAILGVYMIIRFEGGKWRDIRLNVQPSNVALASATLDP